jgi:hypothetical protein
VRGAWTILVIWRLTSGAFDKIQWSLPKIATWGDVPEVAALIFGWVESGGYLSSFLVIILGKVHRISMTGRFSMSAATIALS